MVMAENGKDSEHENTKRFHVVVTGGTSSPAKPPVEVNATEKELHRKVLLEDEKPSHEPSEADVELQDRPKDTNPPEYEEEEDLIDQQDELKLSCGATHACAELYKELQVCNDRVNGKAKTNETCEQELYDFVGCVDHCVSKTLFKFLK